MHRSSLTSSTIIRLDPETIHNLQSRSPRPPSTHSAMAAQSTTTPVQDPTIDRRLVVKVPEDLLKSLRTTCVEKSKVSLLGRIQGKHPGLKALTAWARDTLHPSLVFLSLKANNLFELTFNSTEGRIHALTQTELTCDAAAISFSSWRLHFDAKAQHSND